MTRDQAIAALLGIFGLGTISAGFAFGPAWGLLAVGLVALVGALVLMGAED